MQTTVVSPVCVLIPTYNSQTSLIETLDSFNKEFPLNILIIDDGSSNPITVDREKYLPHFIQIHRKPSNSGIEDSLMLGVEIIYNQGFKYFARIDCGDIAINNRFEKQYNLISSHINLAWVGGNVQLIDNKTKKLIYNLNLPSNDNSIRNKIFMRSVYIHPALMFNTQYVMKVGNYSANFKAAEDMDLVLRLLEHYKAQNINEQLLKCEINPNGISSKKRKTQILSTLKLQFKYVDLINVYWYIGLVKNILHCVIPYSMLYKIKQFLLK